MRNISAGSGYHNNEIIFRSKNLTREVSMDRLTTSQPSKNNSIVHPTHCVPRTASQSFPVNDSMRQALVFRVTPLSKYPSFFLQFLKEVTSTMCDKTIEQPSKETVMESILLTPGPVVSYRAFKHGKRSSRSIAEAEYARAAESL